MRSPSPLLLVALAAAGADALAQKDILYYKFDEGAGTKVINYAAGSAVAPTEGTIVSTNTAQWAPGFAGGSLAGSEGGGKHNYVNSGWTGGMTGDMTIAWFMRQRTTLPDTLAYYFCSGHGNFRAFTSGAGGTGIRYGWGGTPDIQHPSDVRTPAQTRWVHVALVIDTSRTSATCYLDGMAVGTPTTITGGANIPTGTGFLVGMHTRLTTGTFWDMDEFRLINRAATPAEILVWSKTSSAADGAYGKGCGASLGSSNGPPTLGNLTYRYDVKANASSAFLFSIGASRTKLLGVIPLPLDLGVAFASLKGCNWESSLDVVTSAVTDAAGDRQLPLPIPNLPGLAGLTLYNQVLVLAPSQQTSNGFASSIR